MIRKSIFLLAFLVMLCTPHPTIFSAEAEQESTPATEEDTAPKLTLSETQLCVLGSVIDSIVAISPDGRHIACATHREGNECVLLDGKPGEVYFQIIPESIVFSPNSLRLAYIAQLSYRCRVVVVDGTQGDKVYDEENDQNSPAGVAFTGDSNSAIPLLTDKEHSVVYSYDNKYMALMTYCTVDIGDDHGTLYAHAKNAVFFSNKRIVYLAQKRESQKWVVVMRDTGKSGANARELKNKFDKEGKEYEGLRNLVVDQTTGAYACVAERKEKQLVVRDGSESKAYDRIGFGPVVSADNVAYGAWQEDKCIMVIGKEEILGYADVLDIKYSPDSKRLAYAVRKDNKVLVVVDGKEGPVFADVTNLMFSPDSAHIAYTAKRNVNWIAVTDGVEGKEYKQIFRPTFSPDSKHLAYVAQSGEKRIFVVDTVEIGDYVGLLKGSPLIFDSPTKFHALMSDGKEVFIVEVEIKEQ